MLGSLKTMLAAAVAFGGLSVVVPAARAMPMIDPSPAAMTQAPGGVETVRWVCGPFRCFWRPNYYRPYPVYGWHRWHRPVYGYGYGWHHRHRWHRW